jgi:hypothetical protein
MGSSFSERMVIRKLYYRKCSLGSMAKGIKKSDSIPLCGT